MPLGLLHATQSQPGTMPGIINWFTNIHPEYAPHTAYDPLEDWDWRSGIPWDQPSKALRNLDGGVETNNRPGGVVQVEIIGFSADFYAYPDWWYARLRDYLEQISQEAGIAHTFHADPRRLTFAEWMDPALRGWYSHINVPENDHTDPGTLRFDLLEPTVITPDDAATIAAAVWAAPIPLKDDNLTTARNYPAREALSYAHEEAKTVRIKGVPVAAPDLKSVPTSVLLAELARRLPN